MKDRVFDRVSKSPEDWKIYCRHGWWEKLTQQVYLPVWAGRVALCLFLVMICSSMGMGRMNLDYLVAAILVWTVLSMMWGAGQLAVALRSSRRLLVLGQLPIPDDEIFGQQWKAYARSSMGSVLEFGLLYGFLTSQLAAGLVLGMAQWMVTLSVSICLMAYFWNSRVMRFFLFAPDFRTLGGWRRILPRVALSLVLIGGIRFGWRHFTQYSLAVPGLGFVYDTMGLGGQSSLVVKLWVSVWLGAVLLVMPLAFRRLKAAYRLPEGLLSGEREVGETEAARRREVSDEAEDPCAEIKARIRSGDFLEEADWRKTGWLEGMLARVLTPREKAIADFMFAGAPGWTRIAKRLVLVGAGCVAVFLVAPRFVSHVGVMVPFIFVALFGRNREMNWPGMGMRVVGGSSIQMSSIYPVGFWQITRLSLKLALIRVGILVLAAGIPLFIYFAATNPGSLPDFKMISAKVILVALGIVVLSPIFMASTGTNDGTKLWFILLTILVVCFEIALFLMTIFGGGLMGYLAGIGLVCLNAVLVAGYGRAYNDNLFDLQRRPQSASSFRLAKAE